MPLELALLPLVESTLNPYARSPQYALGLWQIMPATGRHLGISSDWWYDGRRDIRESTAAALDYLQTLHDTLDGDARDPTTAASGASPEPLPGTRQRAGTRISGPCACLRKPGPMCRA